MSLLASVTGGHSSQPLTGWGCGVDGQPHPAFPSAFASASSAQQASTPIGAGPPQHEAADATARVAAPIGRVLQTPVSGSCNSTRAAASMSPVKRGGYRARLLMAGRQQKGRRPPIALHADDKKIGFGMGELDARRAGVRFRSYAGSDRSAGRSCRCSPATDRA